MTKIKKLTAVFLAVIMALGVLTVAPFTVSAAGNNSIENAKQIYTNATYSDNLSEFTENDYYKFTLSSPSKVSINFSHKLILDDARKLWTILLLDSVGNTYLEFNSVGNNSIANSCNTGLPSGTYYIRIKAYQHGAWFEHSNVDYSFKVISSTQVLWETENNDNFDTSDPIKLNTKYGGTLNVASDSDCFNFSISKKTNIKINFSHNVILNDDTEHWKISLYDNTGYKYTTFDSKGNESNIVDKTVELYAGTYYLRIETYTHGWWYEHSDVDYYFSVNEINEPTSINLNCSVLTLGAGESYTLTKSVYPSNASTSYTWSSSNASVATVSNGKVTAKKSGTAYITVKTSNGKTAQCKVTVKPAPTSVKTNPASVTLGVGETYTISESTNSGSYANAANLKWSTSNSSVATVTKGSANKATITAKGVGTAYIKITLYNGKTAQCKVTVKSAPTSVTTNPASVTLGKGETYTISESTNSGSYANAANLKWSTSNSSVATVTKGSANKATITAKGVGTAYIKITLYNGKTAQCKVTVKNAPSSVSLSKTSITLSKGATYTISESTNSGSYANAANLKWTSSNSNVATVTKGSGNKAVIKAKAKGTAYIKITLYNGKTAQCKVTVK